MRNVHPLLVSLFVSIAAAQETVPSTGADDKRLTSFDRLMTSFVAEHHCPGAALAVAKDGRLVYSRGFGYADRDKKEPVQPHSLFRIASVSKPITAVAVLQLVEQGKLKLSDKVWDVLELSPHLEPGAKFDPRWKRVTILELLRHTGGWDRDKSFDPMFVPGDVAAALKVKLPVTAEQVIQYMTGKPLDFDPGTKYAYSNFGYCLLGRVIEKVAKTKYEDYVKREVLAPLGIKDMKIGRTAFAERAEHEVVYYLTKPVTVTAVAGPVGKRAPIQYGGWNLEDMDSHGGWIASAEDLVRFASAFNDPAKCKVLKPESIKVMFARPPGPAGHDAGGKPLDVWYGCGWSVRTVGDESHLNTWHNGLLDGTSTLLVRRSDGLTWAVLFNGLTGGKAPLPSDAIDPLVHRAADAVKEWPAGK